YLQDIWRSRIRFLGRKSITVWKILSRSEQGSRIHSLLPTTTWVGSGARFLPNRDFLVSSILMTASRRTEKETKYNDASPLLDRGLGGSRIGYTTAIGNLFLEQPACFG